MPEFKSAPTGDPGASTDVAGAGASDLLTSLADMPLAAFLIVGAIGLLGWGYCSGDDGFFGGDGDCGGDGGD